MLISSSVTRSGVTVAMEANTRIARSTEEGVHIDSSITQHIINKNGVTVAMEVQYSDFSLNNNCIVLYIICNIYTYCTGFHFSRRGGGRTEYQYVCMYVWLHI